MENKDNSGRQQSLRVVRPSTSRARASSPSPSVVLLESGSSSGGCSNNIVSCCYCCALKANGLSVEAVEDAKDINFQVKLVAKCSPSQLSEGACLARPIPIENATKCVLLARSMIGSFEHVDKVVPWHHRNKNQVELFQTGVSSFDSILGGGVGLQAGTLLLIFNKKGCRGAKEICHSLAVGCLLPPGENTSGKVLYCTNQQPRTLAQITSVARSQWLNPTKIGRNLIISGLFDDVESISTTAKGNYKQNILSTLHKMSQDQRLSLVIIEGGEPFRIPCSGGNVNQDQIDLEEFSGILGTSDSELFRMQTTYRKLAAIKVCYTHQDSDHISDSQIVNYIRQIKINSNSKSGIRRIIKLYIKTSPDQLDKNIRICQRVGPLEGSERIALFKLTDAGGIAAISSRTHSKTLEGISDVARASSSSQRRNNNSLLSSQPLYITVDLLKSSLRSTFAGMKAELLQEMVGKKGAETNQQASESNGSTSPEEETRHENVASSSSLAKQLEPPPKRRKTVGPSISSFHSPQSTGARNDGVKSQIEEMRNLVESISTTMNEMKEASLRRQREEDMKFKSLEQQVTKLKASVDEISQKENQRLISGECEDGRVGGSGNSPPGEGDLIPDQQAPASPVSSDNEVATVTAATITAKPKEGRSSALTSPGQSSRNPVDRQNSCPAPAASSSSTEAPAEAPTPSSSKSTSSSTTRTIMTRSNWVTTRSKPKRGCPCPNCFD